MKISQREARRLRKRVEELESTLGRFYSAWGAGFVGGTHLATIPPSQFDARIFGMLDSARRLKHAVCINAHDDGVKFYALPLPKREW